MKNTTKILLLAFVFGSAFGATHSLMASTKVKNVVDVPVSVRDAEILHPGAMPKSYSRFASTTEAMICTGVCEIYDIIMSSGSVDQYAIVYDSAAAVAGTTTIISRLEFEANRGSLATGNPNAFPFRTTRGLALDLSSVASQEEVLVLYRDLD